MDIIMEGSVNEIPPAEKILEFGSFDKSILPDQTKQIFRKRNYKKIGD